MIGEGKTRGRCAILKVPASHNQNTAAFLVNPQLSSEFLYYYLQYNYQNTRRIGSGNNQKALNKERVKNLAFPYTSKEEQDIVVAAIESRLSVCDKLETIVDESLSKAEALRQSILKKAFSGQLVPQDPDDEPADVLLERIRKLKVAK
jgi:type I restriction enzyme S subunit